MHRMGRVNITYYVHRAAAFALNEQLADTQIYFTEFHVFAFQKLLSCRSHIY